MIVFDCVNNRSIIFISRNIVISLYTLLSMKISIKLLTIDICVYYKIKFLDTFNI